YAGDFCPAQLSTEQARTQCLFPQSFPAPIPGMQRPGAKEFFDGFAAEIQAEGGELIRDF
ncbi:MAG TPA: hypothetical protein VLQ91_10800, partial [Draconibacterium sp.]|nr:hypothetical protein [Draconibacterium sp.]